MNASDIKNMTIVSLQEGTKLGRVDQPLFDLAARQLGALQVKGEGGTFILPFAEIQHIGTDAITVASSQVTQTPSSGGATDALLDLHALKRLKIVDQAGTLLGTISDVDVDPISGEVTKLIAHKGGLLGLGGTSTPIASTSIVMVGEELLTVTMVSDSPQEQLVEKTRWWQRYDQYISDFQQRLISVYAQCSSYRNAGGVVVEAERGLTSLTNHERYCGCRRMRAPALRLRSNLDWQRPHHAMERRADSCREF